MCGEAHHEGIMDQKVGSPFLVHFFFFFYDEVEYLAEISGLIG